MKRRTGMVILLRGLPGIGKTTVSAILRDRLEPAVRVSVDTIRYLARPRDLTDETIQVGELAAAAMAETYASEGFVAIVEGVFADSAALDGLGGRLRSAGTRVVIVTLTGTLEDAIARNAARDPEMRLPESRIAWLHEQFDHGLGVVIDTGEHVAEEVAEIIEERLAPELKLGSPISDGATTILFLRHGAAAIDPARYPNHATMELSPAGRKQILGIRSAVRRLAPQAVIASPLRRARESADLLVDGLDLELELELDERLRERTFPELYGQTFEAIAGRLGIDAAQRLSSNSDDVDLEGAETLNEAAIRVQEAIADLASRPEQRILVVSHGGPHGWLCAGATGAPGPRFGRRVELGMARMSTLTVDAVGSIRLTAMNCSPWGLVGAI